MNKEEPIGINPTIKTNIKIEDLKAEDLDKTKKIVEEQMGELNINNILNTTLIAAIPQIAKLTLERISNIEVEGNRVRIKFK